MKNTTSFLIPLATISIFLSATSLPIHASDFAPSKTSPTESKSVAPIAVRFVAVPFRRTVEENRPVQVARYSKESPNAKRDASSTEKQDASVFNRVRHAVLTRIATAKVNGEIPAQRETDRLVPPPRDIEPSSRLTSATKRASSTPNTLRSTSTNRRPIRFYSTAAIRVVH
jgi:hypothetical protein